MPSSRALLCLILFTPLTPAADADWRKTVHLPGGGVVAPDGKVGYVLNRDGEVEALDLATGKKAWGSAEKCHLLAASADRVFGLVSAGGKGVAVRVVGLDPAKEGKRVFESDPVPLPGWVQVGGGYEGAFGATGRVAGGSVVLVWEARRHWEGGFPPPDRVRKERERTAGGVVRVELEKGKAEVLFQTDVNAEGEVVGSGSVPLAAWVRVGAAHIPSRPGPVEVGGVTYSLVGGSEPVKPKSHQKAETLKATDGKGKALWEYPVLGPVELPLRP